MGFLEGQQSSLKGDIAVVAAGRPQTQSTASCSHYQPPGSWNHVLSKPNFAWSHFTGTHIESQRLEGRWLQSLQKLARAVGFLGKRIKRQLGNWPGLWKHLRSDQYDYF